LREWINLVYDTYIYMEMSQWTPCVALLNKNVTFFWYQNRKQEGKIGLALGEKVSTSGRG
jgi:hypothetical protein